jgi:hypothetical protein
MIDSWGDLKKIFTGNFQGVYATWQLLGPEEFSAEAK